MEILNRSLIHRRIAVMRTVSLCMILGLVLAYGWVQLGLRSEMQHLAFSQAVKTRATPAPRGIIFDRNGNKIVDNRRALHLVIQNEDLPSDPAQIDALALSLQLEPDQLRRRIQAIRQAAGSRMLTLMDNLDDSALARAEVLRARFPFLSIEVAPRRVYLGQDLAGHALGYVGEVTPAELEKNPDRYQLGEIIGRTGFEASRNDRLRGVDGQRRILVDYLGREVAVFGLNEAKPGRSVYLTLDAGLQQTLKDALGGENGAGVVLDLRDGGILAMYSSPSYDPNIFLNRLTQEQVDKYWNNPERPMLDRVTQGRYAPGSTFKLLVALCALEKGIITPETVFHCGGHKVFYNRDFRCDATHGSVNLVQAIARSCDIYFYELGMRLDIDDIYATAAKYGLTVPTGVDLPHEAVSRVPSREWKKRVKKEKWWPGETVSVAIGQGANSLTPISLARFYAMLATKGKLLTPHLLYGILPEGSRTMEAFQPPPPKDTGLDPKIQAVLEEGLYEVVRSGTAAASAVPGVTMVGKTGTSQVTTFVDKSHYAKLAKKYKDNALFAGYAPRENPQIAFVVVAENAGFGASSAAPVAKKLVQYWFIDRLKKPLPPPSAKLPDEFAPPQPQEGGEEP
ncbi:penicillin-binding protein 2 [Mesoterricola silvestris]|uniref:Beta-lactamase n=1 Tax=Mesoterricola silvestris TaxID=2927979 RepID=A0AA48K9X4_9BACT|nr:penicillin-binding protein 2 [Mesoterricola silvestris]BDU74434.1 penicillin-binding protein 2 [Mesoterricola silvestris]